MSKGRIKTNFVIVYQLFILIIKNKKWWLLPLLMVIAFLGLFISLAGKSSVLPVIYALF
ncbi:MAG: DUF5989 family protein [Endomicrobiaceae bacterium]